MVSLLTPGEKALSEPHIVIEAVEAVYDAADGDLVALDGIDLSFERGEFVSIIGPSGCGKSTLLRIIGGLMAPTNGRVLVDGKPPREAQRDKQVGFVFQDPSLLPWRTVDANVRLPLQVNRHKAGRDAERLVDLVGSQRLQALLPAPAVRRYAAARCHRPQPGHIAQPAADGRAVRRAR